MPPDLESNGFIVSGPAEAAVKNMNQKLNAQGEQIKFLMSLNSAIVVVLAIGFITLLVTVASLVMNTEIDYKRYDTKKICNCRQCRKQRSRAKRIINKEIWKR